MITKTELIVVHDQKANLEASVEEIDHQDAQVQDQRVAKVASEAETDQIVHQDKTVSDQKVALTTKPVHNWLKARLPMLKVVSVVDIVVHVVVLVVAKVVTSVAVHTDHVALVVKTKTTGSLIVIQEVKKRNLLFLFFMFLFSISFFFLHLSLLFSLFCVVELKQLTRKTELVKETGELLLMSLLLSMFCFVLVMLGEA